MGAVRLYLPNGMEIPIQFRLDFTVISFVLAVSASCAGLWFASKCPYWREVLAERRLEQMREDTRKLTMKQAEDAKLVRYTLLSKRLYRIIIAGTFLAIAIVLMHYSGQAAICGGIQYELNWFVVAASMLIAVIA